MPNIKPDQVNRITRLVKEIVNIAGQPIVLRKYIGRQAGNPALGIQDQLTYRHINTVALLRAPDIREIQDRGGQWLQGRIHCQIQEQIDKQDEVIWQGFLYRVDSEPTPVSIGSVQYWECMLSHAGLAPGYKDGSGS